MGIVLHPLVVFLKNLTFPSLSGEMCDCSSTIFKKKKKKKKKKWKNSNYIISLSLFYLREIIMFML